MTRILGNKPESLDGGLHETEEQQWQRIKAALRHAPEWGDLGSVPEEADSDQFHRTLTDVERIAGENVLVDRVVMPDEMAQVTQTDPNLQGKGLGMAYLEHYRHTHYKP